MIPKYVAKVAVGLGVVCLKRERALITRYRLGQLALSPKYVAQVVMKFGNFVVQLNRLVDPLDGSRVLASLRSNDAKQMQAVCVKAVYRENLSV